MKMAFAKLYFISVIIIWNGFWAVEAISVKEGEKLEIKCSHSNADGNTKYFCKDPCNDRDVLVTSKKKVSHKYSIRDTGNTFYVTISDVTLADAGVYWCGVDRVGLDTFNYVSIKVTPKVEDSQSNASLQRKASNEKLLYSGVSLGALLLILLTAVAIFKKCRHRHVMEDDVTYSDPFKYSQKPSKDVTSFSTASHGSELNSLTTDFNQDVSHKSTSDIYANVQTDAVCYSSVLVSKTRADISPSVRQTSPEPTVYSQVKT